jgi:hypothetical protein
MMDIGLASLHSDRDQLGRANRLLALAVGERDAGDARDWSRDLLARNLRTLWPNAQRLINSRRLSVMRTALLAAATIWCASHPTNAMTLGVSLSQSVAFAEAPRRELVRWRNESLAFSCNLRIPCPFSELSVQRRRPHLTYPTRGFAGEPLSASQERYKPCPASVAFPNGRLACLGLP